MSGDSKGDFQWQILINSWKVWLVVSKFNGPERVCHFIGLLINERLFIKDERSRRGLADYPLCKIYGEAVETNPNVVRSCCSAKALRNQVLPTLASNIKALCNRQWELQFGYSSRETIKAADFIQPKLYFFTDLH
ncbi:hypothetical protein ES319_A11G189800v1 [Gossypium barbadense]|uniref:Uncharacterized protein n=3 Tax=Gossypium TaxID=3633 RepID=A0A5J5TPP6_GOSBA|nr:hypothetical protein ES319_A11G189800v1 [Gossypium barbadense]TYG94611.1 hypothetical protein ES288_A11G202000v1 [Gossypium darwinii]TYI01455.1 hypothetical protein ES332_A11G201800v1 [Gossypium tomentosum]